MMMVRQSWFGLQSKDRFDYLNRMNSLNDSQDFNHVERLNG